MAVEGRLLLGALHADDDIAQHFAAVVFVHIIFAIYTQREVAFLTVHSMLHLLGYDHENGGLEAMRMREKEEAVLLQLGLPRTVSYTE